jgi:hypothetical protein
VEDVWGAGIGVIGSSADIDATHVSGIAAAPSGNPGRAIEVEPNLLLPALRPSLTIKRSRIESAGVFGVMVQSSDATIEHTAVESGGQGDFDGVLVSSFLKAAARAELSITNSAVSQTPRAGLSNFGAKVSLGTTRIDCAAVALDGEAAPFAAMPPVQYQFSDLGGNVCGCGTPAQCKVLSSTLQAPSELPQGPDVGGKSK